MGFLRAAALTISAAAVVAQSPAAQTLPQSTSATCSISGDVSDEDARPVSNVNVVLFPADEQKWAGGVESKTVQWMAVSAGAFKLGGFPPGDYKLAITPEKINENGPDLALIKALAPRGFPLTATAGGQGQVRLFVNAELKVVRVTGSATVLRSSGPPSATLPAGTGTAGIRVSNPSNLPPPPRGPGAISGTVTDADGRPVAGAHVQRFLVATRNGVMLAQPTGQSTTTDEHGVYHLTGLTPGESVVAALARSPDYSAPSVPMIEHMPAPAIQPDGRKLGYVTTYYGSTDTLVKASKVTVGAAEITGIDFSLQRQPVTDVSGTFTAAASGTTLVAFGEMVILIPSAQANGGMAVDTRRVPMDREGHFSFTDVPLGDYLLTFTSSGGWVHQTVSVSEATAPLAIALQAPFSIKGRVEFLGDTPAPADAALKPFRVRLTPSVTLPGARSFEVAISAKGEFTFKGVPPARYVLQSVTAPPWAEMSGAIGGRDTLDIPVDVTSDRDDALVVLVDREAGVSGTVKEEGGAHDALVVVYSADRQYWTSATRRVRISRIVAGSGFSVSSLPPGQYLAFALPLAPDMPAVNNALLDRYQSQAQRFDLVAREHKTIEIKMLK
ncbi:MAG TPA: carboxypeptidase-like regulatory domain-containing protein [Vicinamibacterales bacterium]|nr:carboxypeptidase-like regulatory domain-containing protein [Vicinamibacterales bacterium]